MSASRDDFHAYYDHLFQPVNIEDEKQLSGANASAVAPIKPELDDFFETGWEHRQGGATLTADAYYRAEKNTVDDSTFANTQIDIPYNYTKGYARGLEFAVDGPLGRDLSYYANFARSWAKAAGPINGGLLGAVPTDYFYVDHDQTNTASFGVDYEARGVYANLDGEYGSGFPYGQLQRRQRQSHRPELHPRGAAHDPGPDRRRQARPLGVGLPGQQRAELRLRHQAGQPLQQYPVGAGPHVRRQADAEFLEKALTRPALATLSLEGEG